MSASVLMPQVRRMLDNPGIYIGGDTNSPTASVIIVSCNGHLFSTRIDTELAPDRFYDTFIIKAGPIT